MGRSFGLVLAALVASASLAACTSQPHEHPPLPSSRHETPPSSSPVTPAASPTPAAATTAGWVAGTDGPVYVLASGPGAVFFLIAPQTSRSPLVARYDVHTHDMATGPRIQGAADLAYAGGSLRVSAGVQSSAKQPAGTKLYRLNPSTLQIADTFSMPKPVMPLLPTPAGLWSGSDGDLYLVDPASGAIKRTVAVTGSVGQLAWEKTNHLLYDSTHRSGFADAFAVEERSAASGALVVRSTRLRNV